MAADTEYGLDGADASSSTWSIGERGRLEPGPHLIELFGFLRSAGDEVEELVGEGVDLVALLDYSDRVVGVGDGALEAVDDELLVARSSQRTRLA